jgi:hypothetical protein
MRLSDLSLAMTDRTGIEPAKPTSHLFRTDFGNKPIIVD